jgi:octopamine receptor
MTSVLINDQEYAEQPYNVNSTTADDLESQNDTAVINDVIWVKNCSSALDNVDFDDPRVLGSLVALGMVCLMVIFGNIMVIAAVKITHKLRGATNIFIVSLAWADLMLGIIVLPFSAMYEVFKMWLFGPVWCSIWLAVDVWMCTASILHLVVISLDR